MDDDRLQALQHEYFRILGILRDEETSKEEVDGDYIALIDSITCDSFVDKVFRYSQSDPTMNGNSIRPSKPTNTVVAGQVGLDTLSNPQKSALNNTSSGLDIVKCRFDGCDNKISQNCGTYCQVHCLKYCLDVKFG